MAGLFSNTCQDCRSTVAPHRPAIVAMISRTALINGADLTALEHSVQSIVEVRRYEKDELVRLLVDGWCSAVDSAFDRDMPDSNEEKALADFVKYFSLPSSLLDEHGHFTRLVKAAVIREALDGKLPKRMDVSGNLPFNLKKSEEIVWVFEKVKYFENQTRTQYLGGSRGVSIRIGRGLYYRVGEFRGERIQSLRNVHADTGLLAVTSQHIYFHGPSKAFRIPYSKIVSFEPFADGFGLNRDALTAQPQTFETGDGWFVYNLVTNLARR